MLNTEVSYKLVNKHNSAGTLHNHPQLFQGKYLNRLSSTNNNKTKSLLKTSALHLYQLHLCRRNGAQTQSAKTQFQVPFDNIVYDMHVIFAYPAAQFHEVPLVKALFWSRLCWSTTVCIAVHR